MNKVISIGLPTIAGMKSYDVLKDIGFLVGEKGVEYYAEAHLSKWNAWIHTTCMPFTIYGMLFWISALLRLKRRNAKKFNWFLYLLYGGHYLRVNAKVSLVYYLMYYYVVVVANRRYRGSRLGLFKKGMGITTLFLLIQEVFGHWIGGDIASRPEGVANAIIYAIYFSAGHFVN
jgi:hypothetical protein